MLVSVRIKSAREIMGTNLFIERGPADIPKIYKLYDKGYFDYFKRSARAFESVYPYVSDSKRCKGSKELSVGGYYCFDIHSGKKEYYAARALIALFRGRYYFGKISLCFDPSPGHHAEKTLFGGFCYFNIALWQLDV